MLQALSSTVSEILQYCHSIRELLWIQPLLFDMGFKFIQQATVLHGDNQPAEFILKHEPTHNHRTKHMDLRIKFCGEVVRANKIVLRYINTKFNLADIFTKPFPVTRFRELRRAFVHDLGEILRNSNVIKQSLNVLREFLPNRN